MQADELVSKNDFLEGSLQGLRDDDITVLEAFSHYQTSKFPFFDRVEVAHEFMELLTFKIKESKSRMDKEYLAQFSLTFFQNSIKTYGFNPKFVATQLKSLITYYQNQKNLDKAIEVCELLIRHGITDDDSKGFHVRLDDLYRLRKKVLDKGGDLSMIDFSSSKDDFQDEDEED